MAIAAIILTTTAAMWPLLKPTRAAAGRPRLYEAVRYDAGKLQGLLGPQQMTSYDAGTGSHARLDYIARLTKACSQMLEAGPAVYREGQPLTF